MKKAATLVTDNSSEIKFSYASYKKVSVEKLLLLTESLSKKYPHVEISPIDIFQINNIKTKEHIPVAVTLKKFYDAGARILDGRHSNHLDIEECLSFHRIAHSIGYRSHLFLVYKHMQKIDEWLSYLDRVRNLQHEFEGFLSFTPVPFKHFQSNFNKSDIAHDLKIMSLSRIFLLTYLLSRPPLADMGSVFHRLPCPLVLTP